MSFVRKLGNFFRKQWLTVRCFLVSCELFRVCTTVTRIFQPTETMSTNNKNADLSSVESSLNDPSSFERSLTHEINQSINQSTIHQSNAKVKTIQFSICDRKQRREKRFFTILSFRSLLLLLVRSCFNSAIETTHSPPCEQRKNKNNNGPAS